MGENLWFPKNPKGNVIAEEIKRTNSYRLAGLFDLALDLSEDPSLARLHQMRHLSTHHYLLPHYEYINLITAADGEEYHTNFFDLADDCIKSLQIARSAIIYLTAFIDDMERAKRATDELTAPIYSPIYRHYDIPPL